MNYTPRPNKRIPKEARHNAERFIYAPKRKLGIWSFITFSALTLSFWLPFGILMALYHFFGRYNIFLVICVFLFCVCNFFTAIFSAKYANNYLFVDIFREISYWFAIVSFFITVLALFFFVSATFSPAWGLLLFIVGILACVYATKEFGEAIRRSG